MLELTKFKKEQERKRRKKMDDTEDDTEEFIVRGPVVPVFSNGFNHFVIEYKENHTEFCRVSFNADSVKAKESTEVRANYIAKLLNSEKK